MEIPKHDYRTIPEHTELQLDKTIGYGPTLDAFDKIVCVERYKHTVKWFAVRNDESYYLVFDGYSFILQIYKLF